MFCCFVFVVKGGEEKEAMSDERQLSGLRWSRLAASDRATRGGVRLLLLMLM
jgi:hypothetical protein